MTKNLTEILARDYKLDNYNYYDYEIDNYFFLTTTVTMTYDF